MAHYAQGIGMRGVFALALFACGIALPVSAAADVFHALLTMPEPAAWVVMLGGLTMAGMAQHNRRIAAELA
jgi:hypothetical protein